MQAFLLGSTKHWFFERSKDTCEFCIEDQTKSKLIVLWYSIKARYWPAYGCNVFFYAWLANLIEFTWLTSADDSDNYLDAGVDILGGGIAGESSAKPLRMLIRHVD